MTVSENLRQRSHTTCARENPEEEILLDKHKFRKKRCHEPFLLLNGCCKILNYRWQN